MRIKSKLTGLVCRSHVSPPSSVCKIVPFSPTAQPVWVSMKKTSLSALTKPIISCQHQAFSESGWNGDQAGTVGSGPIGVGVGTGVSVGVCVGVEVDPRVGVACGIEVVRGVQVGMGVGVVTAVAVGVAVDVPVAVSVANGATGVGVAGSTVTLRQAVSSTEAHK